MNGWSDLNEISRLDWYRVLGSYFKSQPDQVTLGGVGVGKPKILENA